MNKLYINDNLETLKGLESESIDAIITDPPYLTNNKKLTYSDSMSEEQWIDFMTERLKECHRVLKPTGTLLMNIDERMVVELQTILFGIFGKKNRICTFIWKKRASAANQAKFATVEHEYICAYAKDIKKCKWNGIPQFEAEDKVKGFHIQSDNGVNQSGPNQHYPLYIDNNKSSVKYETNDGYGIYGTTDFHQQGTSNTEGAYPESKKYTLYYTAENGYFDIGMDGYGEYNTSIEFRSKNVSEYGKGSSQQYPLYIKSDGYGKYMEQPHYLTDGMKGSNHSYYTSKTKISLTPFPGSIEVKPMNGKKPGCWRCIPSTCQKLIDADMLVVKNGKIYQKQYQKFQFNRKTGKLEPFVRTSPIRTIILEPTNLQSNKEIKEIYGESKFTYAKPLELVKRIIKLTTKQGDTVLDIFAGSGTVGQAAYELNRKFILCQINEGNIPALLKERLNKTIGNNNYKTS